MLAKRRGRSHGNADRSERGKAAVRGRAGRRKTNVRQGEGERGNAAGFLSALRRVHPNCGTPRRAAARQSGSRRAAPGLGAWVRLRRVNPGCGASVFGLRRIRLGQGAPIRDETRPFGLRRVGPACGARIRTAARHRLRRVCMPQRAESGRGASIPSIPTAGRTFCGRAAYSDSTGRALCPQTAGLDARERAFFVESIGRPARGHIS